MTSTRRLGVGSTFYVPVDDAQGAIGQLVAKYQREAYLAIFDGLVAPDASVDEALRRPVKLIALTFDSKIASGEWPLLGERPVSSTVELPAYSEAVLSGALHNYVVDYSGQKRRSATPSEVQRVPSRVSVSPALVREAVKAAFGKAPWIDMFDPLIPNPGTTTKALGLES